VQGKRRKKTCFLLKVLKQQKLPVQCSVKACTIGYNDIINNLVMQTLRWLPKKILRHIHKKDFPFFEPFPAHVQSKPTKSAKKSKQKFFIKKCNMDVKKTQNLWLFSIR
jgi:hypothetical protein